jgi:hypothetical protein
MTSLHEYPMLAHKKKQEHKILRRLNTMGGAASKKDKEQ